MLKPSLLALATVAALAASTQAEAALSRSANVGGTAEFVTQHSPLGTPAVLYDQTGSASGNGAPDQNFEASLDIYDSEGADDFEVTDSAGWTVTGVNTVGTTGLAGGATVAVTFYSNSATNFPDTAECTYTGIVPTDSAGSFTIALPTPCVLGPGLHWVAIQTTQTFESNGQHFWSNRTVLTHAGGVWRNPGNGFSSGCTAWERQTVCGVGGGTNPDFLFQIVGIVGGLETDLAVSITDTPDPVTAGEELTYQIEVTNDGDIEAEDVAISLALPAEATLVSATASDGGTCTGTVDCSWATALAAGESFTAEVIVAVAETASGPIEATVTATSTTGDPDEGNNEATATTEVEAVAAPVELTPYRPVPATGSRILLAMFAVFLVAGFLAQRYTRH